MYRKIITYIHTYIHYNLGRCTYTRAKYGFLTTVRCAGGISAAGGFPSFSVVPVCLFQELFTTIAVCIHSGSFLFVGCRNNLDDSGALIRSRKRDVSDGPPWAIMYMGTTLGKKVCSKISKFLNLG